jgi:hypothetical protein
MGHRLRQEIVVNIDRRMLRVLLLMLTLGAIAGLAALGRSYTPVPARVIGWGDWQALKVERQYRRELSRLREDLADLADMVKRRPDPVRAEMAAARYAQNHAGGLGLLEYQRDIVLTATEVVRDWASGYETYEDAVAVVNMAVEALEEIRDEFEGGTGNETTLGSSSEGSGGGAGIDAQAGGGEWWADLGAGDDEPDR